MMATLLTSTAPLNTGRGLIVSTHLNTCMKIEQMSEILDKQDVRGGAVSNAERMSKAIRSVLTEDVKLMSQGKEAYEKARRMDFERKIAEDYKNPRKMSFSEMVNRYL